LLRKKKNQEWFNETPAPLWDLQCGKTDQTKQKCQGVATNLRTTSEPWGKPEREAEGGGAKNTRQGWEE